MTTAISVKNIGKRYKIGAAQQKFQYNMFRDVIMDTLMTPVRVYRALRGQGMRGAAHTSTIWALKDVSFDLEEGKVLGIVGRNGAGKSTLMNVLAGLYKQEAGIIKVKGKPVEFSWTPSANSLISCEGLSTTQTLRLPTVASACDRYGVGQGTSRRAGW